MVKKCRQTCRTGDAIKVENSNSSNTSGGFRDGVLKNVHVHRRKPLTLKAVFSLSNPEINFNDRKNLVSAKPPRSKKV